MAIQVDIVSPDKSLFSGEANMVTLPGQNGEIGIMGSHAPLLSTLGVGEVVVQQTDGDPVYIALAGGVVEVRPNKVTILADEADSAEDIDVQSVEQALARARQSLEENPPSEERAQLLAAIQRSNLRLRVAERQMRRSTGRREMRPDAS